MRSVIKILRYAAAYKSYSALNIVFNILSAIFNLLTLLLFIPFLNLLFMEKMEKVTAPIYSEAIGYKAYYTQYLDYTMSSFIETSGKSGALLFICITIVILFFLKNLTRYLAMYFLAKVRNGVVRDLRYNMYRKMVSLPIGYYTEERKGDIISRITNDVSEVEWSIMQTLELLFREPFTIIIFLVTMFFISTQLTLFALVLMPISALVIGRISKSLKRTSALGQKKMGELVSSVDEMLSGLRIVKSFNAEEQSKKRFETENNEYNRLMIKLYRKRDLASPLSEFMGSLVLSALVWYGGQLIFTSGENEFNGKQFIGFVIVFSQLMRPIQSISSAISSIHKGMASIDRINEVLNAPNKIVEPTNPVPLTQLNEKIEYKNISFSYGERQVLTDINFTLHKGKTIALVGPSGSGKSTLADLLPRFYDIELGEIAVDGVNIKNFTLHDLRAQMGIVSQESILFNDTVLNNIALGDMKPDLNRAIEAAKIANAHEFIDKLENGYHTNIGERGMKLSGGQRQRMSIARAVYKNPPVLILDEATSSLDTESEKLVQDALNKLMKNRTTLVIAHRLSTIQHADEILVIEEGRILERGTHKELYDQKGLYYKLCSLQSFS